MTKSKERTLLALKDLLDKWLLDGDIEDIAFKYSRGVKEIAPKDMWKRSEPGKGRTLTVKINGGAVDEAYIPELPIRDDWPEG